MNTQLTEHREQSNTINPHYYTELFNTLILKRIVVRRIVI